MVQNKSFLGKVPLKPIPQIRKRAEQGLTLDLIPLQDYLQAVLSVEPLIDIATSEAQELRKSITHLLSHKEDLLSIEILTKMTKDAQEPIRLSAAIALDTIDSRY